MTSTPRQASPTSPSTCGCRTRPIGCANGWPRRSTGSGVTPRSRLKNAPVRQSHAVTGAHRTRFCCSTVPPRASRCCRSSRRAVPRSSTPGSPSPRSALRDAGIPVEHVLLDGDFRLPPIVRGRRSDRHRQPDEPDVGAARGDRLKALPGRLVVDEAFMDAVPGEPESLAHDPDVLVLRSLTKTWGLAGLRAGYFLGDPETLARPGAWGVRTGPWAASRWKRSRRAANRRRSAARERFAKEAERAAALRVGAAPRPRRRCAERAVPAGQGAERGRGKRCGTRGSRYDAATRSRDLMTRTCAWRSGHRRSSRCSSTRCG